MPRRALAELTVSEHIIADLTTEFDGYTVVALADLHHRNPWADVRWLRHAVDLTNAFDADIVVLLGDYGSSFKRSLTLSRRWYDKAFAAMAPDLTRLRARDGVLAVLGNHDYYAGEACVRRWLHQIGADVLVNEARYIKRSVGLLRIAGMDDVDEGQPDPLVGCALSEAPPTLVLSHNPDGIDGVDPRLRMDVMIAGHTHGGQIVIPGFGAPVTMSRRCGRRTACGWVQNPRTALYVTRGLGEQLPLPMRIGCPPEVFVLRLRRGAQQPA